MGTSVKERVAKWLEAQQSKGAKRTSIVLYPETQDKIGSLIRCFPEDSINAIINKVILAYEVPIELQRQAEDIDVAMRKAIEDL